MKKNMGHRYLISSLFFLFSLLFNLLGAATTHSAPPAARSPAARSRTLTRHRRRSARRRSVGRVLALHRSAPLCRPPVRLPACSGCSPPPCAHPPPPPPRQMSSPPCSAAVRSPWTPPHHSIRHGPAPRPPCPVAAFFADLQTSRRPPDALVLSTRTTSSPPGPLILGPSSSTSYAPSRSRRRRRRRGRR